MNTRPFILARSIVSLLLLGGVSHAVEWTGAVSNQWNDGANWQTGQVPQPGQDANIVTNGGNAPVISTDIAATPTDIRVGQYGGGTARLDHTAGFASTGGGNWMTVGAQGGTGVYNLANTATTGGSLTGFGTGSGSMRVNNSTLWVGGTREEPGGTGIANINTTGTLNVGAELNIGSYTGTGTMRMDAGSITGGGNTYIGRAGGTGTFSMSGGTITRNAEFFVGVDSGSTGTMNVSGGTVRINNWLNVGRDNGTGALNMTGGSMYVQREVRIGFGGGGIATMALSGGAVVMAGTLPNENSNVEIGAAGGSGTATVSGAGTVLFATSELHVGNNENSVGNLTVSGGMVSTPGWMAVGREGSNGVMTINGGIVAQGSEDLGGGTALELTNNNKPSTATINLDGGTLIVNRIVNNGGGNTNLYLNGGTIKSRLDRGDFLQGLTSVTVRAGGAKFDTNGKNITVNQALVGDATSTGGGLTKSGAGNLTLTATETFTGPTMVNSGQLILTSTASLATSSGFTVRGDRGALIVPGAGGPANLPGAVLFIENGGNATSTALGTGTVTLGGGSLQYHGGQGAGLIVNTLNLATGGAIAAQPQFGGGLIAINNLQLNAMGTSTATFISTYGNIGVGDNTADVGHVNIATINGVPTADVVLAQRGIMGGWATTFSTNNNADTQTHFATYGPNGVQAVTYDAFDIGTSLPTFNVRSNFQQSVVTSQTLNSLETTDGDILVDGGAVLTLETGGLIFGGLSHAIREGAGAGSITAGAASGNMLFATVNEANDYQIRNVAIANRGTTPVGFVKGGSGTLRLDTANTYTGATRINNGMLQFNRATALYNGGVANWTPANITVNSGATIAFSVGGANGFTPANISTLLTNLTAVADNGLRADSAIAFDTSGLAAGGTFTIPDAIKDSTGVGGGSIAVVKLGGNTLVLGGVNTHTGGMQVRAGTVRTSGTGTLGAATGPLTISSGATVDLNGTNQAVGALNGAGSVTSSVAGPSILTVSSEIAPGTFTGVISNGAGTVGITKTGDGIQTLTGLNTYTGPTTIAYGTLRAGVGTVANIGGAFGINSAISFTANGSAVLELAGFNTQVASLSGGTSNATKVLLGNATLTLGGTNGAPANFAGMITGSGALVKNGPGTQILSNGNNHTGGTTINGGTLRLAFGSNLGSLPGSGPIVINSGGILEAPAVDALGYDNHAASNTITINEGGILRVLEGGRLSMDRDLFVIGGTIATEGENFDSNGSYVLRTNGATYTFTSTPGGTPATINALHFGVNNGPFNVIKGGGPVDLVVNADIVDTLGTGGFSKNGNGVMALNNPVNTVTGPATVNDGALLVAGSLTGSVMTVNGGRLGGDGGTLGSTAINSGGTLAPGSTAGSSIGTLNFSNSLTLGGTTLMEISKSGSLLTADLANVTFGLFTMGGNLTVTSIGGALSAGDTFNLFDAGAFTGTFTSVSLPNLANGLAWKTDNLVIDGTITVIPEPSALLALMTGAGMLLGVRRRRSLR